MQQALARFPGSFEQPPETTGFALGVLPWAHLSDRVGRIVTIRWAAASAMVLGLIVPFAPSFEAMTILRGIEGVALANLRNPTVLVLVLQAFLLMGGFVAAYNSDFGHA